MQDTQVQSLSREDSLEKEMQPTPVFLPREFHGQKSLVGYSPWGGKELDTTEKQAHFHSPKSSPVSTDEWGVCRHSEGAE